MNASIIFLLVAALVTLHFTLASPTNLGSRQGPEAIACTRKLLEKSSACFHFCDQEIY
jgi:hypothetical protein